MKIGNRFILWEGVMIFSDKKMIIGDNVTIGPYTRIGAMEEITLGSNIVIGRFATILDHDHHFKISEKGDLQFDGYITAPVKMGSNIWLGDKCTILKGVTIGDNVIAGANTLINKDVPPNCVIAGVPFKIIRTLP